MQRAGRAFAVAVGGSLVVGGFLVLDRRGEEPRDRDSHHGDPPALAALAAAPATRAFSAADHQRSTQQLGEAWQVWRSSDLGQFAANLRSAGVAERVVRAIIAAEIDERYAARELALAPPPSRREYWQFDDSREPLERKLARLDLKREKARLRFEILGPDPAQENESSRIPQEKQELARLINEDYDALISEITRYDSTLLLPSEQKLLAQLHQDRERELAALFTPDERVEYEARTTRVGEVLRRSLRGFAPTEEEFRAIFVAEREFNTLVRATQHEGFDRERIEQLNAAQAERDAAIREALGDARHREYLRQTRSPLQSVRELAARVGAPPEAADRVIELREVISRESRRIGEDFTQSVEARQAAIVDLARRTRAEIEALLGPEGSAAYMHSVRSWFGDLERGYIVEVSEGGHASSSLSPRPLPPPPPAP